MANRSARLLESLFSDPILIAGYGKQPSPQDRTSAHSRLLEIFEDFVGSSYYDGKLHLVVSKFASGDKALTARLCNSGQYGVRMAVAESTRILSPKQVNLLLADESLFVAERLVRSGHPIEDEALNRKIGHVIEEWHNPILGSPTSCPKREDVADSIEFVEAVIGSSRFVDENNIRGLFELLHLRAHWRNISEGDEARDFYADTGFYYQLAASSHPLPDDVLEALLDCESFMVDQLLACSSRPMTRSTFDVLNERHGTGLFKAFSESKSPDVLSYLTVPTPGRQLS